MDPPTPTRRGSRLGRAAQRLGCRHGRADLVRLLRGERGARPRGQLLDVLATFAEPGSAVDLGCGSGIDTLAMLDRGWTVLAIDAQPEAIERLRTRAGDRPGLTTAVSAMEDTELRPVDLLWASYSLFFCDPPRFPEVWGRIRAAVRPGGRFAGELLGERDTWATTGDDTAFTRARPRRCSTAGSSSASRKRRTTGRPARGRSTGTSSTSSRRSRRRDALRRRLLALPTRVVRPDPSGNPARQPRRQEER